MPIELVSPPSSEPVSLEEVKEHLRIDTNDHDGYLQTLISAARIIVEGHTNRALVSQQFDLFLNCFRAEIVLPNPKLISVDSINYIDTNKDTILLDSSVYQVNTKRVPGRIIVEYGQQWPQTRQQDNAVIIRFTCGYGERGDVPRPIKQAIKLLIGHLFNNREESSAFQSHLIPFGVDSLLGPYVIPRTWVNE